MHNQSRCEPARPWPAWLYRDAAVPLSTLRLEILDVPSCPRHPDRVFIVVAGRRARIRGRCCRTDRRAEGTAGRSQGGEVGTNRLCFRSAVAERLQLPRHLAIEPRTE